MSSSGTSSRSVVLPLASSLVVRTAFTCHTYCDGPLTMVKLGPALRVLAVTSASVCCSIEPLSDRFSSAGSPTGMR